MKYSFIIPVYGCEKYLEACVNSVVAQKGTCDFEVILVDDGSRDNSGRIAEELACQDSRIRVYHKENGGAASARNAGLREAKGEYILFIDGDDTVADQLLQCVDAALEQDPNGLILFGMSFDYYREQTCVRSQQLSCSHEGWVSVQELLEKYKDFFYDNALSSACNKVFSAQIIRENGLRMKEGMILYEDYDFVLRYLRYVDQVCCVPQALYHYRNDLEQTHLDLRVENMEKLRENMRWLLESASGLAYESPKLREVSAELYLILLWKHLVIRDYTREELARQTVLYCQEPAFRRMLMPETCIGEFENRLLTQIDTGAFRQLHQQIRRRRYKSALKRGIKALLKKTGLKGY